MVKRVEYLSDKQLKKIRRIVGEAFVSNELFHNWGTPEKRRKDVLRYMSIYVDYVYQAGNLYANDKMTGFIGLEDSKHKSVRPQLKMLGRMLVTFKMSRIKSLIHFSKQVSNANAKFSKQRHMDALMVCVDRKYQGKGIASELVYFAKAKADKKGIPLLFDTDMKEYADMYQHLGCRLYNTVTADNGVTRYSLCYVRE